MLLVMRMIQATSGDRIEPAFVPGVTAGDALDREPHAAQGAMVLDGLERVMRTRRIETAVRPEQWAQADLVCANEEIQDEAHVLATRCQRVARLACSVAAGASRDGNFAETTMSTAGSACCERRNDSRTIR